MDDSLEALLNYKAVISCHIFIGDIQSGWW